MSLTYKCESEILGIIVTSIMKLILDSVLQRHVLYHYQQGQGLVGRAEGPRG